jgi:hypothetical protein
MCILYAYKVSLKVSSKCIHPNYFFYWFECFHMICPNLSSAPCTVQNIMVPLMPTRKIKQFRLALLGVKVKKIMIFQHVNTWGKDPNPDEDADQNRNGKSDSEWHQTVPIHNTGNHYPPPPLLLLSLSPNLNFAFIVCERMYLWSWLI